MSKGSLINADEGEAGTPAAESSFAEIRALVERRQAEVTQSIRRISEEKRRALEDQLALIESERSLVREQCDRLNSLVRQTPPPHPYPHSSSLIPQVKLDPLDALDFG
ncbi:hypothetical protein TSMEX_005640 [Taenia solium]|eukprot:TsM_000969800 transcript=TsM_000969800 gene=TsM_000969800